jgi:hypothetical protein
MYTLTYESKSYQSFENKELEELLTLSRLSNTENGIMGCLIYNLGDFIQVLEGEKERVLELYKKIKADKRHSRIHLFLD